MNELASLERREGESSENWALRLVDDLTARHQRATRLRVESYLERLAGLSAEPEVVLDLLLAEWTLRRQAGEAVALDEYVRRFPGLETPLRDQWSIDVQTPSLASSQTPLAPAARGEGLGVKGMAPAFPDWYVGSATFPVVFGAYRLLREFGGGGMGRVFLAEPLAGGAAVALKVPTLPLGQDDRAVADRQSRRLRFVREAKLAAKLNHPRLCKALDVNEESNLPYFTMPYYPGGSVASELQGRGWFDPREAARLTADVARALQYAHERNVIHRDLKPSNLLRDDRGDAIVTDFGLALPLDDEETRLTVAGTLIGTLSYLSPEQAVGSTQVTSACDVYSLGVILYELLGGKRPFVGPLVEVLRAISESAPTPLEQLRPDLSPALAAICRRAMAKRPEARYPTMAAFADDLDRFLGDARPAVSLPGWRWWAVGLVAAMAVGLAVFLGPRAFVGGSGAPKSAPIERIVVSERHPIGLRGPLRLMRADLGKLDKEVRPHVRYFSLMAVYDNPYVSDEDLALHRKALQRLLNRLSHHKREVPVHSVEESGWLLRIDLRDLDWEADDEWATVLKAEPYGVRYDAVQPDEAVRRLAREIDALTATLASPCVRADWFVEAASRAPLYDRLQHFDGKERRTPPFDLTEQVNAPISRVVELYRAEIDGRVAAAELGLRTVGELERRWPKGAREVSLPVSRAAWSGADGEALFARMVKALKRGVPRSPQAGGVIAPEE